MFALTEFTIFPRLPQELQDEIWKIAAFNADKPSRIVQCQRLSNTLHCQFRRRLNGDPVPPLLHACTSSRRVTQLLNVFDRTHGVSRPYNSIKKRKFTKSSYMATDIMCLGYISPLIDHDDSSDEDDYSDSHADEECSPEAYSCSAALAFDLGWILEIFWSSFNSYRPHWQRRKLCAVLKGKADASRPFRFTKKVEDED